MSTAHRRAGVPRAPGVPALTTTGVRRTRAPRRHRLRAVATLALALVVVAGAAGLLGVRSTTERGSGGGYEVAVEHAAVDRAGLDVPFEVQVRRAGGFDGPLVLAMRSAYFDLFEEQGLSPAPVEESADAEWDYLTFAPPPGEVFVLGFDAYVQPAAQVGAPGEVRVLVDGAPVVAVPFRTRVLP